MATDRTGELGWRQALRPTGARPSWRTVGFVVAGASTAALAALAVHGSSRPTAVLTAAVAGGLVAATGANAPRGLEVRLATTAAAVVVLFEVIAVVVAGRPWWAAAAMAVVAVLTSVAAGAHPLGAALGLLATIGFVVTTLVASAVDPAAGVRDAAVAVSGAPIGVAVGIAVTAVIARAARSRDRVTTPGPRPEVPNLWPAMARSLRTRDEHLHDGVRRALPLGLLLGLYEASGNHDLLWVFLAALAVLLPTGKRPLEVALVTVASAVLGVALLLPLSVVLPVPALVGGAVLLTLLGVAYRAVHPLAAGAATASGAVVMVGAPAGAVAGYGAHRVLDTVLGAAVALLLAYGLWPRDRPRPDEPAPEADPSPDVPSGGRSA